MFSFAPLGLFILQIEVVLMSISISVDISGKVSQYSPHINKAVRSAVKTSLNAIKDKWQYDMQRVLKSNQPIYLAGGNPIQYPLDAFGFSGVIVLPELSSDGSMALNIKSDNIPPAISTSRPISSVFMGNMKVNRITPKDIYALNRMNRNTAKPFKFGGNKSQQKKGLQHLIEGYHSKPKNKDPLKALRQKSQFTIGSDKLMPFAQRTFVEALTNNLNGIS